MRNVEKDVETETQSFTIKQAAALLSVSTGTVRNWLRSGRIQTAATPSSTYSESPHKQYCDANSVRSLQQAIASGNCGLLQKRRNKTAVRGTKMPLEYIANDTYAALVRYLVTQINECDALQIEHILLELALKLLYERNWIHVRDHEVTRNPCTIATGPVPVLSFTELLEASLLDLGVTAPLLNPLRTSSIDLRTSKTLRTIRNYNIPWTEEDDLLGLVYQSLTLHSKRKTNGSYYTPTAAARELVAQSLDSLRTPHRSQPRILDPCCGSGLFLMHAYSYLKRMLHNTGTPLTEADKLLREQLIYGYDIDAIAVTLARLNLTLLTTPTKEDHIPLTFQLHHTNALVTPAPHHREAITFDLVIGNPPWGAKWQSEQLKDFKRAFPISTGSSRSLESFALFIEYGLLQLKPEGLLTYVLPESILNVSMHQPIRQWLLTQFTLEEIHYKNYLFHSVNSPVVTMQIRNKRPSNDHTVTVHTHNRSHHIHQSHYGMNPSAIINGRTSSEQLEIIRKLFTRPHTHFLKDNAQYGLGIVTGNNRRFLTSEPLPNAEPIVRGASVFKFNYVTGDEYIVFSPTLLQQVASTHIYRAPEKLVYRFISEQLVFAYDDQQRLTLNSANIVIPQIPDLSILYVMAILNARTAQFIHRTSFASIKVLRTHLETLPIPACSKEDQLLIETFVYKLRNVHEPEERSLLYEQLDDCIMDLYGLQTAERQLIRSTIPSATFLSTPVQ